MATSQIGQLRTENANRKVWLVKVSIHVVLRLNLAIVKLQSFLLQVPNFVAKQWKEVSEKAINEDHEAIGPKLASVLMSETGPAGKAPSYVLHLSEEQQSFGHPTEYRMNVTTRNAAPMVAFSQEGQRLACEGTVYQKFDLEVSQKGLEVDPAYRALNRERHKAAAVKNRSVQLVSDHKVTNARQPVYIGAGSKKSTGGSKRLAKPKEDLERELSSNTQSKKKMKIL